MIILWDANVVGIVCQNITGPELVKALLAVHYGHFRGKDMQHETVVTLRPEFFGPKERSFIEHRELSASLFRYDSGVEAVRLRNARGQIVVLPFHGQQIWDARFDDRILTMRSMFPEPRATREYLCTYGAFLLHCGATAMGNPSREDTHPLHGELPNAPYGEAWVAAGSDGEGPYIAVGGEYRHTVAFACDYTARPRVTLRAGQAVVPIAMEIRNRRKSAMELMYLAHVNFRPLDGGRLVSPAPATPEAMRVRTLVPANLSPPPGYREFLSELAADPARHQLLEPGLGFDPEVVFFLSCKADESGWVRSLMVHPDGCASYIGYAADTLDHAIRWISRTSDQDCLGLLLPATAEPDGYRAEKAKGNVKVLEAGQSVRFELEAGLLTPEQASAMERKIAEVLRRR
jgi:hypothetical protein